MPGNQIVIFILASVLVIACAYYSTYFLAGRTGKIKSGRMIKLIERFSISKDKSICLVEIKDKVYLVAMTGQNVTLLDKIDIKDFEAASVVQKNKPASSKYEPQGVLQKGLFSTYISIKDGIGKRKSRHTEPTGKKADNSGRVNADQDNLDLVYKKIHSRLSSIGTTDLALDEEKDI